MTETTHFGYQEIPLEEKQRRVGEVFSSVATRYDIMNDVMSLGMHRLWKPFAVAASGARRGHKALDLAGGTGDISTLLSKKVGPTGQVVLTDINGDMLNVGRDRLIDRGLNNLHYAQVNAEMLPFPDNYFDVVTIAFGLRNVTDKDKALAAMQRVLKPGGKLMVLEFSTVVLPVLEKIYEQYSFNVIPKLGEMITNDRASYQYLVESIRKHPDQATLRDMMQNAGLSRCDWHNLTGGIVAVHHGVKL